jgi:histidinol dehydrogenase
MPLRLNMRSPDFKDAFESLLAMKREAADDVDQAVQAIIAAVIAHGDDALIEFSKKFDRVDLGTLGLRVTQTEIEAAVTAAPADAVAALRLAHERIVTFHERQKPQDLRMRLALNWAGVGCRSKRSAFMSQAARQVIRRRS